MGGDWGYGGVYLEVAPWRVGLRIRMRASSRRCSKVHDAKNFLG